MYKTAISTILFLCSITAFSQTTVTVDWANNSKPDVTYKRGTAAPGMGGFFDNDKTRDYLDYQRSIGMTIFNGIRNLFKDGETNEFYFENGEYKNQQIPKFTNIRKYAADLGFELISQVGGTPRNSNYEFDSTFYKGPYTPTFEPWTDFAPIPKEGKSMQEFQRNFSEWAINADKAVGDDFHSIWIGTQEIAHTIGFPGGNVNDTHDNKKLNIRRFTDYWKPISDSLRAAGAKTGGIQLNSSNTNLYNYAVDYMIQQKLHLDYLTYQFYQWGDTTDLRAAVNATKRYSQAYPGTKLIIDRGGHGKLVPSGASASQAVIYFLVGELGAMNNADWIYAYTPDRQINGMDKDKNTLLWLTKAWINTTGNKRCNLSGLPTGVDGFAVHNGKKISIALWNRNANTRTFNILLNNANFPSEAQFSTKYANNDAFVPSAITWDAEEQTIKNISLKQYDYVLLDIESTISLNTINTKNKELVVVYPNPTENILHISGVESIRSVTLFNAIGKSVYQTNKINNNSIDISSLLPGIYVAQIKTQQNNCVVKFMKN